MQDKSFSSSKSAFTLIELLVVIGIIGILAGVMLGFFSGTTDAARATECMNNMRALAQAVNSYAAQDLEGEQHPGAYPAAGSFLYHTYGMGGVGSAKRHGWIACCELPDNPGKKSKIGKTIGFAGSGSDDFKRKDSTGGLRYALTHGRLWSHVNGSRKVYQCPVHAGAFYKKYGYNPGWSYVMNSWFGWASNNKDQLHSWSGHCLGSGGADRRLLFAEIQGVDVDDPEVKDRLEANLDGKGEKGDSVLDPSKNEYIGFNHKQKTGRWAGHVAFMDGHVTKLIVPPRRSRWNIEDLTKNLCDAKDFSFTLGTGYDDIR